MNEYRDRNGITFAEYKIGRPKLIADWPRTRRVKQDTGQQAEFHLAYKGTPCWWCGEFSFWFDRVHELHHLCAGSAGRSHERCLFTWLCRDCHREHVAADDFGRLLFLKWKYDPAGTDWVRTAIRYSRFLPELITEI